MLNTPYGFSALFESMQNYTNTISTNEMINDFACGMMECSVIGDDIDPSDFEDGDIIIDEDEDEIPDDLRALDNELESIVDKEDCEDDKDIEALSESMMWL